LNLGGVGEGSGEDANAGPEWIGGRVVGRRGGVGRGAGGRVKPFTERSGSPVDNVFVWLDVKLVGTDQLRWSSGCNHEVSTTGGGRVN
jgi:hypothetical protein